MATNLDDFFFQVVERQVTWSCCNRL